MARLPELIGFKKKHVLLVSIGMKKRKFGRRYKKKCKNFNCRR